MKKNIPLRLSFLYIGFCFFAALFTYFLIPDKIKNLSPIVFNTKSKLNISGINPICYDSNLNEKYINSEFENTFFDIEIINKCNLIIEENNFKSIDNLISRYF